MTVPFAKGTVANMSLLAKLDLEKNYRSWVSRLPLRVLVRVH